jgi:hypothetical protein
MSCKQHTIIDLEKLSATFFRERVYRKYAGSMFLQTPGAMYQHTWRHSPEACNLLPPQQLQLSQSYLIISYKF